MHYQLDGKPAFFALVQAPLLTDRSFEISVRSFLKFFHSLTPKHRKRVHFVAIDATEEQSKILDNQDLRLEMEHIVMYSMRSLQVHDLDRVRRQDSISLHPNPQIQEVARVELLSMCLPILTFDSWERAHAFDQASCIFVRSALEEQSTREFANLLRMLYFDPGALKMLREKALNHRRSSAMRIFATAY